MRRLLSTILSLSLTVSCTKESPIVSPNQLVDEKASLIGKWNWASTYHMWEMCSNDPSYEETILSEGYFVQYSIEFKENGYAKFYRNDSLIKTNRIIFGDFYDYGDAFVFNINLDNNPDKRLLGWVWPSKDSIMTYDYPFNALDDGCEDFRNSFVKE
ncbi:MAG: hypothetical protein ACI8XB_003088 [Patiriisocius sp.]|jgi:hypothetical protein